MKIVINGGHYPGLDSGAVSPSGLQEAIVVRDIMKRTACYLRNVGYDVLEVQRNELYEITDDSNGFDADIFVSIHCNSAGNSAARGTETFYCSTSGAKLAQCIQLQIIDALGTVDRGIKVGNFYVLRNTNAVAVLVETAFISNSEDESLLSSDEKCDEFAKAIARGITDYV